MMPPAAEHGVGDDDPRPIVRLPRAGLPGGAIAAGSVVAALLLFAVLDARRSDIVATGRNMDGPANAFQPAPDLTLPEPVPTPAPPPTVLITPSDAPPVHRPAPGLQAVPQSPAPMLIAPVLPPASVEPAARPTPKSASPIVFGGEDQALSPDPAATGGAQARPAGDGPRAAAPTADVKPARAEVIRNRTMVMPTGTLIPAVLETPIDSARPGLVRAMVSKDTRGFDGRRVLVPRGSRLIGEYLSDVRSGQKRVLVNWTRLIRPDGVTIALASPAADEIGGAGVPGKMNTFFLQRFAGAILQSALTVGVNLASRPANGSVIVGLPNASLGNTVGDSLLPRSDLSPKITVKQGAVLNVFVARDLDFSGFGSRP